MEEEDKMNNPKENEEKKWSVKKIYDVEISEFEFFCIRMISDYLFLDRFNDSASFVRFEQCFGPLFNSIKNFKLVEAFKEIVGKKKKYITFRRMIKAYINWKKENSKNYSFNYFMNEVFKKMIIKKGEIIGRLVEGERVFSTRNCKNSKIITKLSVQTDKSKNKINGFIIEYDEIFKSVLCLKEKKEDINLELNFNLFHSKEEKLGQKFQLDRDGISHIAGKYEENSGIIKFLIFKCRSGKTMYIGDSTEKEGEKISPFIFGSSRSQLKSMTIALIKDQLAYIQPKYQISTRINENLDIKFEDLNEKYLENDLPKYEEREYENISEEKMNLSEQEEKKFLFPLISDDHFVDKMSLTEEISGKYFNEVYKSYFEEDNSTDKLRDKKEDYLNKENREKKIENEQNNLVKSEFCDKNNFDSVFVNLIKFKNKIFEKKEKEDKNENEEFIEEEDENEEDNLNLEKIKSGEYIVKEQKEQRENNLRNNNNINIEKKDESAKNNLSYSKKENVENKYNNHSIVEIKYTNKKKDNNNETKDNKTKK